MTKKKSTSAPKADPPVPASPTVSVRETRSRNRNASISSTQGAISGTASEDSSLSGARRNSVGQLTGQAEPSPARPSRAAKAKGLEKIKLSINPSLATTRQGRSRSRDGSEHASRTTSMNRSIKTSRASSLDRQDNSEAMNRRRSTRVLAKQEDVKKPEQEGSGTRSRGRRRAESPEGDTITLQSTPMPNTEKKKSTRRNELALLTEQMGPPPVIFSRQSSTLKHPSGYHGPPLDMKQFEGMSISTSYSKPKGIFTFTSTLKESGKAVDKQTAVSASAEFPIVTSSGPQLTPSKPDTLNAGVPVTEKTEDNTDLNIKDGTVAEPVASKESAANKSAKKPKKARPKNPFKPSAQQKRERERRAQRDAERAAEREAARLAAEAAKSDNSSSQHQNLTVPHTDQTPEHVLSPSEQLLKESINDEATENKDDFVASPSEITLEQGDKDHLDELILPQDEILALAGSPQEEAHDQLLREVSQDLDILHDPGIADGHQELNDENDDSNDVDGPRVTLHFRASPGNAERDSRDSKDEEKENSSQDIDMKDADEMSERESTPIRQTGTRPLSPPNLLSSPLSTSRSSPPLRFQSQAQRSPLSTASNPYQFKPTPDYNRPPITVREPRRVPIYNANHQPIGIENTLPNRQLDPEHAAASLHADLVQNYISTHVAAAGSTGDSADGNEHSDSLLPDQTHRAVTNDPKNDDVEMMDDPIMYHSSARNASSPPADDIHQDAQDTARIPEIEDETGRLSPSTAPARPSFLSTVLSSPPKPRGPTPTPHLNNTAPRTTSTPAPEPMERTKSTEKQMDISSILSNRGVPAQEKSLTPQMDSNESGVDSYNAENSATQEALLRVKWESYNSPPPSTRTGPGSKADQPLLIKDKEDEIKKENDVEDMQLTREKTAENLASLLDSASNHLPHADDTAASTDKPDYTLEDETVPELERAHTADVAPQPKVAPEVKAVPATKAVPEIDAVPELEAPGSGHSDTEGDLLEPEQPSPTQVDVEKALQPVIIRSSPTPEEERDQMEHQPVPSTQLKLGPPNPEQANAADILMSLANSFVPETRPASEARAQSSSELSEESDEEPVPDVVRSKTLAIMDKPRRHNLGHIIKDLDASTRCSVCAKDIETLIAEYETNHRNPYPPEFTSSGLYVWHIEECADFADGLMSRENSEQLQSRYLEASGSESEESVVPDDEKKTLPSYFAKGYHFDGTAKSALEGPLTDISEFQAALDDCKDAGERAAVAEHIVVQMHHAQREFWLLQDLVQKKRKLDVPREPEPEATRGRGSGRGRGRGRRKAGPIDPMAKKGNPQIYPDHPVSFDDKVLCDLAGWEYDPTPKRRGRQEPQLQTGRANTRQMVTMNTTARHLIAHPQYTDEAMRAKNTPPPRTGKPRGRPPRPPPGTLSVHIAPSSRATTQPLTSGNNTPTATPATPSVPVAEQSLGTAAPATTDPPRRKRGRPKKNPDAVATPSAAPTTTASTAAPIMPDVAGAKRSRQSLQTVNPQTVGLPLTPRSETSCTVSESGELLKVLLTDDAAKKVQDILKRDANPTSQGQASPSQDEAGADQKGPRKRRRTTTGTAATTATTNTPKPGADGEKPKRGPGRPKGSTNKPKVPKPTIPGLAVLAPSPAPPQQQQVPARPPGPPVLAPAPLLPHPPPPPPTKRKPSEAPQDTPSGKRGKPNKDLANSTKARSATPQSAPITGAAVAAPPPSTADHLPGDSLALPGIPASQGSPTPTETSVTAAGRRRKAKRVTYVYEAPSDKKMTREEEFHLAAMGGGVEGARRTRTRK